MLNDGVLTSKLRLQRTTIFILLILTQFFSSQSWNIEQMGSVLDVEEGNECGARKISNIIEIHFEPHLVTLLKRQTRLVS